MKLIHDILPTNDNISRWKSNHIEKCPVIQWPNQHQVVMTPRQTLTSAGLTQQEEVWIALGNTHLKQYLGRVENHMDYLQHMYPWPRSDQPSLNTATSSRIQIQAIYEDRKLLLPADQDHFFDITHGSFTDGALYHQQHHLLLHQ
jgi:hypothetical protein